MHATTETFFSFYRKVAWFQRLITSLFGLACLLLASLMLSLLALESSAATNLLLRIFGASLIYVSVVTFLTRHTHHVMTVRGITIANIVEDGLLCLLSILGLAAGTLGGLSWLLILVFAGEVVLNTYVLWRMRQATSGPTTD